MMKKRFDVMAGDKKRTEGKYASTGSFDKIEEAIKRVREVWSIHELVEIYDNVKKITLDQEKLKYHVKAKR